VVSFEQLIGMMVDADIERHRAAGTEDAEAEPAP
jgi:hypothetical protein